MKSKNIPADIRTKTVKEAQDELKEIITKLENVTTKLENSIDQYSRMIQLNHYIQEQFKKKAKEIKRSMLNKDGNILSKN